MASYEVEIQNLHSRIKHISDYKLNCDVLTTNISKTMEVPQWKFYNPTETTKKSEAVMISNLKMVQRYLHELDEPTKLKTIKSVKSVSDLYHFERRLDSILGKFGFSKIKSYLIDVLLDLHATRFNIKNLKEFQDMQTFFQELDRIKGSKDFNKVSITKLRKSKNKESKLRKKHKSDKENVKSKQEHSKIKMKHFEDIVTIEKKEFFQKTQMLLKEIYTKKNRISSAKIYSETKKFMRRIGF